MMTLVICICKDWWNWIQYGTITCGVPQGSTLRPLLFLLYINDSPNSSEKLSFRIFADDTNVFFTSSNPNEVECTMNEEIKLVLNYCSINKLSVNFKTVFLFVCLFYHRYIGNCFVHELSWITHNDSINFVIPHYFLLYWTEAYIINTSSFPTRILHTFFNKKQISYHT